MRTQALSIAGPIGQGPAEFVEFKCCCAVHDMTEHLERKR
jgi:hypothetical protein